MHARCKPVKRKKIHSQLIATLLASDLFVKFLEGTRNKRRILLSHHSVLITYPLTLAASWNS